ncbi:MAG: hypothetical protein UZ19_OD1000341 [Parcubacteria bacterium OLB19]|nr:MAG: hypothetical protein UZ19_OD1000341 [Parcubacteria bacterium OLB19]
MRGFVVFCYNCKYLFNSISKTPTASLSGFLVWYNYVNIVVKVNIYIDGNNLYRAATELGYKIDYKKFRGWLRQKYTPNNVYLFIGLIPNRIMFYEYLQECGFILVFKQTINVRGMVKGNCDAELVLKSVSDFYKGLSKNVYYLQAMAILVV